MRRAAGLLNMFDKAEGFALLPRYLAAVKPAFDGLEARLAQSDGPFFSGEAPGYGDLGLFAVVDSIVAMKPDFCRGVGPGLAAWWVACAALPGIGEYLEHRPQLGTGALGNAGSFMAIGHAGR